MYYILRQQKKIGSYDILTEMSKHVTLVHLINSLYNLNHAISVVGYWIFDSNNGKALVLNGELLDIICDPSVGEEQAAEFET